MSRHTPRKLLFLQLEQRAAQVFVVSLAWTRSKRNDRQASHASPSRYAISYGISRSLELLPELYLNLDLRLVMIQHSISLRQEKAANGVDMVSPRVSKPQTKRPWDGNKPREGGSSCDSRNRQ